MRGSSPLRPGRGATITRRGFAAALLAILAACRGRGGAWIHPYGVAEPLVGRIFDVQRGRFVDENRLVVALRAARYVILGETHDNADHHRLQARLLRALAPGPPRLRAVIFEMLDLDQQEQLVEHLDLLRKAPDRFAAAIGWEQGGWPPFAIYEPVFRAALEVGAEIVAGGLPPRLVKAVSERGFMALPPRLARATGLQEPLPPQLRQALEERLFAAHCGRLARDFLPRMVAVQRARDALLAERLVTLSGQGRGALIAGRGHARIDWGVPYYLRRLAPEAAVRSLAFLEVGTVAPERLRDQPYDFLWLTPRAHPESYDPCRGITTPSRPT